MSLYLALFVHLVVGQFDLFKGDDLLAELVGAERRVRVGVEAGGSRGIRLAGHQPRGPVVGVAVALPVHGNHVQQDVVADLVAAVKEVVVVAEERAAGEGDADGGEHPPGKERIGEQTA